MSPGDLEGVLQRRLASNVDAWRRRVEWLGRTGLGTDSLARWSGLSITTVQHLLKADSAMVSWRVLDRVAELMELDDPMHLFMDGYDWNRHFAIRRFGRGGADESFREPPRRPSREPGEDPPWRWRPEDGEDR